MHLAYWLGPFGEHRELQHDSHVRDVLAHPEVFGTNAAWVHDVYRRHGEPLGVEGHARAEILRALIGGGWIRVRWRSTHWEVTVHALDSDTRRRLGVWAERMVRHPVDPDLHREVLVTAIGGEAAETVNLGAIGSLASPPAGATPR